MTLISSVKILVVNLTFVEEYWNEKSLILSLEPESWCSESSKKPVIVNFFHIKLILIFNP